MFPARGKPVSPRGQRASASDPYGSGNGLNQTCLPFLVAIMVVGKKREMSSVKLDSVERHYLRFMGHKGTIRPNAKKLSSLFKSRNKMEWETFARKVKSHQRGFMGEPDEMRQGRGEFHEYPYSCICQKPDMQQTEQFPVGPQQRLGFENSSGAGERFPRPTKARRYSMR